MPSLVRRFLIFAAVDGLVLQPNGNGHRNSGSGGPPSIQIAYKTQKISALPPSSSVVANSNPESAKLEAYGIVGILSVASHSFLISITRREQVAQILGRPIYAITDVAVIPLSSQADADHAIEQVRKTLRAEEKEEELSEQSGSDVSDTESNVSEDSVFPVTPTGDTSTSPPASLPPATDSDGTSNIAQEVINPRGRRTRFGLRWPPWKYWGPSASIGPAAASSAGSTKSEDSIRRPVDDANQSAAAAASTQKEAATEAEAAEEANKVEDVAAAGAVTGPAQPIDLMPKLLRYTKLLFSSRNFFFAYDYDLTRRFGIHQTRKAHLPLHSVVDPLYFWNRHLLKPFIDHDPGGELFALPLIQGFVGQREFTVASTKDDSATIEGVINPSKESEDQLEDISSRNTGQDHAQYFLLTLISRRSVKRPGLRYLRRGVDDEGNTANTVETEQILSTPEWDPSRKVYSLLQIRGSIPLYFSQSPYALRPTPIMHRSSDVNQAAFDRHFLDLSQKYGKVQAVSLVDKHEPEVKIGEAYEAYVRSFNDSAKSSDLTLGFEWFDFHQECRGMKFDNVRRLVNKLQPTLDDFGYTVVQGTTVLREQTGIVRTNCMDCLDRTGVAQCAFAQRALEQQLESEGLAIDLHSDDSTRWFNTLWADNGDAISKQYASTAALKGDYTRTRKRNYRGALNDLGLTLSRYYNNIVNDYFSQACIDYLLGNVSIDVFSEFQVDLKSVDPGISAQKLRQNAIDACSKIVVDSETEELLGGWTMLSPRQPNTLRTLPFEETVLLLTDSAVYNCRFDWNTDKVLSFERVNLRSIRQIHHGTYITSVLTEAQTDENKNVGLVIVYEDGKTNQLRVNTRSLRSEFDPTVQDASGTSSRNDWDFYSWLRGSQKSTTRIMAFKAIPVSNSVTAAAAVPPSPGRISEAASVKAICQEIERAVMAGDGWHPERMSIIEEKDIISLAEARRRTGYLEQLVYDIKKLVWA